jgi:hypothetical protein
VPGLVSVPDLVAVPDSVADLVPDSVAVPRCPAFGRLPWVSADPAAGERMEGGRLAGMPVLDPNPQNGKKKMLLVFGAFLAIFVIIGIIATIASP